MNTRNTKPTTRSYLMMGGIAVFNFLSFAVGVVPPAGRAYYLPEIIVEITILMLFYFMFFMPIACLIGIAFSGFQMVKERCLHKGCLIWIFVFIVELVLWYIMFHVLMSV